MAFKKILMIYPRYPGSHYSGGRNTSPPIGLGIIGEMLKLSGVDYEVVDLGLGYDWNYLEQRIKNYQPDGVAISMMTFRYKYIYSVLKKIKELHKNVKIIAGGPHITAWKVKVLEQCSAIDFGVSREGEFTIRELCQGRALSTIKGLIYREGDNILFNGERELIDNLDFIPFPRYEKFELDKYEFRILISSSRGCPYKCIFCQSRSMLGKEFRGRSAQNIFDEIVFWYGKGYANFNFVDDNFTMCKDRIYKLCELIKGHNIKGLNFYVSGLRADTVDKELLKLMKEVGFTHLCFGIESASDNILRILKKQERIANIEKIVSVANKLGYYVRLYFVVGSPYETLNDVRKSVEFARKYASGGCNFGSLMPIPNTELMEWVKNNGTLLMKPDYYLNELAEFERLPYFDGPGMTRKEKYRALKMTEKVRIALERQYKFNLYKEYLFRDKNSIGLVRALILFIARVLLISKLTRNLYESNYFLKKWGGLIKKQFLKMRKSKVVKTVIHYTGTYLPITENWIYAQISHLSRYTPIIYCDNLENFEVYPAKNIRVLTLRKRSPRTLLNRIWRRIFGFYPSFILPLLKDRPDIIHAHFGDCAYYFLVLKRMFRKPLISSFYGQDFSRLPRLYPKWKKRYADLFRNGNCFLVEGNHMKKCLVELGCPEDKIIVQHIGVDLAEIKFVSRRPDASKEVKILVSATFREKKGIPYAIKAFGKVKRNNPNLNLKLTIIGDSRGTLTDNEEKGKILSAINEYGLKDSVSLLGFQPNHIFRSELYRHHIFLSPSVTASDGDTEGGVPVSIIEASASGMPVLSTTHCDIPEVIINKESGYLVPERDVDALAEKLRFLIINPQDWERMGARGRRHIEENYDITKQAHRLEEIYDKILKIKVK